MRGMAIMTSSPSLASFSNYASNLSSSFYGLSFSGEKTNTQKKLYLSLLLTFPGIHSDSVSLTFLEHISPLYVTVSK